MQLFILFVSSHFILSAETTTTDVSKLPSLEALRGDDGFKTLSITQYLSLDTYESTVVQGYQLGCDNSRNGKIGYCAQSCGEVAKMDGLAPGLVVSQACAELLDQFMPKCLNEIGCTNNASFCGSGGHAKRVVARSNTPSRHSSGDALDLFELKCTNESGTDMGIKFDIQTYSSNTVQRARYDKFKACWVRQVDEYNKKTGNNCGGAISCEGSGEPANSDHNDHMHISCPIKRGNVSQI